MRLQKCGASCVTAMCTDGAHSRGSQWRCLAVEQSTCFRRTEHACINQVELAILNVEPWSAGTFAAWACEGEPAVTIVHLSDPSFSRTTVQVSKLLCSPRCLLVASCVLPGAEASAPLLLVPSPEGIVAFDARAELEAARTGTLAAPPTLIQLQPQVPIGVHPDSSVAPAEQRAAPLKQIGALVASSEGEWLATAAGSDVFAIATATMTVRSRLPRWNRNPPAGCEIGTTRANMWTLIEWTPSRSARQACCARMPCEHHRHCSNLAESECVLRESQGPTVACVGSNPFVVGGVRMLRQCSNSVRDCVLRQCSNSVHDCGACRCLGRCRATERRCRAPPSRQMPHRRSLPAPLTAPFPSGTFRYPPIPAAPASQPG